MKRNHDQSKLRIKKHKEEDLIIRVFFLILLLNPVFAFAAEALKPMITSSGDTVHIFIRGRYMSYSGFEIYRKGKGEREFKLLAGNPVTAVDDPLRAQEILGTRYDFLSEWLKTETPEQLLHKMKTPDVATILRYCGIPYAKILGRYYQDATAREGNTYNYRIIMLDWRGKEFDRIEVSYKVKDEMPTVKTKLSYEQEKDIIKLMWKAPEYTGKIDDDFVGFNIYRKGEKNKERLNFLPVLRMKEILWIDREAEEDNEYVYSIFPVDVVGREGKEADRITVKVEDLTPPLVPEGLDAQKGIDFIRLTWNKGKAKDIVSYKIFRAPSLNAKYGLIGEVPGNSTLYIDKDMLSGKPYFYKIQAIDDADNISLISGAVWAVAQDTTPPLPPTNITYKTEDNKVFLEWSPSTSKDLKGYFISRGFTRERKLRITPESIEDNQFADEGKFYPGHTYHYGIVAVDISFNESPVETLSVKIPDALPPSPPFNCSRSPTEQGFVRVSWQQSMSLDVELYRVYRYKGDSKKLIKKKEGKPFYFIDSLVTKGEEYSYSITAVDSSNNESEEAKTKSIIPTDITPPAQPENVNIKVKENGIEISWNMKPTADLKGFDIYRCNSIDGVYSKINKEILKSTSFFDRTGKKGLYYKICSLDTSNNESFSKIERAM